MRALSALLGRGDVGTWSLDAMSLATFLCLFPDVRSGLVELGFY
ncbi:hypothetical protein LBBP_03053 [Leptospira borgpetersenii serovar Ballum]|uniref:Uncharacterized protein n=1 Tax=Leptospira borgpetersenii serovar Ballum TaxID=280505 RepID=A0A0S2IUD4_LEPBO|nr:hypothetical protein LBBP_03053 [Leptospira borgpetersenii serovar Ballum]